MDMPEGGFKLASLRFSLENGKTGEFALEGFDGRTPQGPVKVTRFALKSVDIAGLLRKAALFSNPAQPPLPDQALGMIALLKGASSRASLRPTRTPADRSMSISSAWTGGSSSGLYRAKRG